MNETEFETRMARISVEAAVVAEEVWTEDEPTLAEYELTQTILDAHARLFPTPTPRPVAAEQTTPGAGGAS